MPEIKAEPVFAPPPFPEGGRLNLTHAQLVGNYRRRNKENWAYQRTDKKTHGLCQNPAYQPLF